MIADHERIYELIVARDADGAAREMHRHIAVTYELLVAQETGDASTMVRQPWPEPNS